MIPKKSKQNCVLAGGVLFGVTEEVFRRAGNDKMVSLTTGKVADEKTLKERSKGTWLKVSLQP